MKHFILVFFAAATVVLPCAWYNVVTWQEAFGSGPPYYDRSTNMDKWSNPLPSLVGVDLVATLLLAGIFKLDARRKARQQTPESTTNGA